MAKVKSSIKLSGTLGDHIYYENAFGQQVRSKNTLSEWHVQHAASFENTRRNAAEWKHETSCAQLLRWGIGELYQGVKNPWLVGRVNGALQRVVRSDMGPEWGKRRASGGNLALLEGFEFNDQLPLDDALPLNIENHYTINNNKVSLQLPAFRLRKKKKLPARATHYRVVSALVTVDFAGGTFYREIHKSPLYAMGRQAGGAFTAEHILTSDTVGHFWMMGIEFFASDKPGQKVLQYGALRIVRYLKAETADSVGGDSVEKEVVDDKVSIIAETEKVTEKDTIVSKGAATVMREQPIKVPAAEDSGTLGKQPADHVAYRAVLAGWNGFSSTMTTYSGYSIQYTHRS